MQSQLHKRKAKIDSSEYDPTITYTDERKDIRSKAEPKRRITPRFFLEASVWSVLSALVAYYSEIISVLLYSDKPFRPALYLGFVCIVINIVIAAYHIIWVQFVLQIDKWEEHNAELFYIAIGSILLGFLSIFIGLWSVYKLMAPVIIIVFGITASYILSLFSFT